LSRNLDEKLVVTEQSYPWLKIKEKTESTVVAAQDQAISPHYFKNKILKEKLIVNASYVNNMTTLLTI